MSRLILLVLLYALHITTVCALDSRIGHGGSLLYDAQYSCGPSSSQTNDPGQWINDINTFNNSATSNAQIQCLYPYSGDIKIDSSCDGNTPSSCIYSGSSQNVHVLYNTPAYGQASVAAYRTAFPNALILAIIDAQPPPAQLSFSSVGVGASGVLTAQICSDSNVDGVFFDLEPMDFTSPGLFSFVQQTTSTFMSTACQDASHPTGRTVAVFVNPNKIAATTWPKVAAALGKNGYLALSGYDLYGGPAPENTSAYQSSLTGMLQTMDAASKTYKIPYTVVIPAASSDSEFEQFGSYNAALPPSYFQLITDYTLQGISQKAYLVAAIAIMKANCKSPYFLGVDYWSWGQYKSPNPNAGQLLEPNIPTGDVVTYLQQSGGKP